MSDSDRIRDLERQVSELMRNADGQWWRFSGGGGGGGGGGTVGGKRARVLAPGITKATGNLVGEYGDGPVNYLDDTTGAEIDDPQTIYNAASVAYVADTHVFIIGTLIIGRCTPEAVGWWDGD